MTPFLVTEIASPDRIGIAMTKPLSDTCVAPTNFVGGRARAQGGSVLQLKPHPRSKVIELKIGGNNKAFLQQVYDFIERILL